MTGVVTAALEAIVPLTVRGPQGQEVGVEAVLDTGFTDDITLPADLIAGLALTRVGSVPVTLADGSSVLLAVYFGQVIWDGQLRDVLVFEAEGGPLLGMSLLLGSRVTLDVEIDGPVTIEALP